MVPWLFLGADPWIDALMGPEFYIWLGGAKYVSKSNPLFEGKVANFLFMRRPK